MKTRAASWAALLAAAATGSMWPGVSRAEWTLQPRVTVGSQDYSFNFFDVIRPVAPLLFAPRDGFEVGDRVDFSGAGLTIQRGRWFGDLSLLRSGSGQAQTQQFVFPNVNPSLLPVDTLRLLQLFGSPAGPGALHDITFRFRREELNAVIGFGVNSNLSVFAGYKDSKTTQRGAYSPRFDATLPVTSNVAFGNIYLFGEQVADFNYSGAFLGASYAAPVERWSGAFAIQASVARLTGDLGVGYEGSVSIAVPAQPLLVPIPPAAAGFSTTGNTPSGRSTGLNLGISWTGRLGWVSPRLERLSYTIGLDRSDYSFSAPSLFDFSETITRARLDLRYSIPVGQIATR